MEYKKKCNVCGKIFCYTDEDLKKNAQNAGMGALTALGGLASALGGGTIFHTHHLQGQSDRFSDKIVDYDQCPYCHSRDLSSYTGETNPTSPVHNEATAKTININTTASTESLLKRAFIFLEDGDWVSADAYCEACLDRDPELAEAYLGKLMAELHVRKQEQLKNLAKPFDNSSNYQKALRFADDGLKGALINCIEYINTRNESTRLVEIYNRAKSSMSAANTEHTYKEAAHLFRTITDYKDSATLAKVCLDKAEIARKDAILSEATFKMTGDAISNYESAIKLFESISGWKNADEKIYICKEKIEEIKAKEEQARNEAERTAKRHKRFVMTIASVTSIIIALIIVFIAVIIPNNKYNEAMALMNSGNVIDAYEALTALDGYKDSEEKAKSIYGEYLIEKSEQSNVYITIGKYEQDNNISNGREEIEWLVLDVKDNKVLVISKYGLDCQPFNTSQAEVTWENCTLRKWLNDDFLNKAFNDIERATILTVTVSVDKYTNSSTESDITTQDKVFLLSEIEADKYFTSREERICQATDYAVANGVGVSGINGNCYWMLRSTNYNAVRSSVDVRGVDDFGNSGSSLSAVDSNFGAVRPALWIELDP